MVIVSKYIIMYRRTDLEIGHTNLELLAALGYCTSLLLALATATATAANGSGGGSGDSCAGGNGGCECLNDLLDF